MNEGSLAAQNAASSGSLSSAPEARTTASFTSSSPSSEGTPNAAHSSTAGCRLTSHSMSKEEMFSPRRRIASAIRSRK